MGIFSPFIIFGHTWDLDTHNNNNNKSITALIPKSLFYNYFKPHSHFKNNGYKEAGVLKGAQLPSFKNNYKKTVNIKKNIDNESDYISVTISILDRKKQYLKLTYKMQLMTGEFILSTPLSKTDYDVLNRFRMLGYQHIDYNDILTQNQIQQIQLLQNREMDSKIQKHYTVSIPEIEDEQIVKHLFNYLTF